jgi:hypothetical protein
MAGKQADDCGKGSKEKTRIAGIHYEAAGCEAAKSKEGIMKLSIITFMTISFFMISYCQEKSYNHNDTTKTFNFIAAEGFYSFNTFNNTLTRAIVPGHDTTISLHLSAQELNTIRAEMERIHILDYPRKFSPPWRENSNGMERGIDPFPSYYLKIKIGNQIKEITWMDTNESETKLAENLRSVIFKIFSFIHGKEEYKKFPPINIMLQ